MAAAALEPELGLRQQQQPHQGGEALELIRYDTETGKFKVGARALAILRDSRTPLSVVAVCGRARQGKSFILNQLLQVTGGFQIGSTTRPCTKGLWMWSTPQRRVDEDGREFHIVLLDTEGIDAYDQTAQYSTQIFSLAVLLSSLFVYNQMGGIDEAALDRLSLVTEMTKHIKVRANSQQNDHSELREFTPSFLWLLRDFYLKLEDEHGHKVAPNDYLETALLPVPGAGAAAAAKNAIRTSIKSLFPDRDCATLVRPMHDEQALVSLDHIDPHQLRPEFKDGVAALIRLIFAKAQPKRMGSFELTGPVLAGLTEAYVEAINNGAVPTIATAWQGVAEQECRRASDIAESAYAAAFNESVMPEEPALDAEHARCMGVAAAAFADVAVGEDRIRRAHEQRYADACTARFAQIRARKLAEASARVNELLLKASSLVSSVLADVDADPASVQAMLAQFLDQYVALAAGPHKWPKLVDFLKTTYPQVIADMLAKKDARSRADVGRLAQELEVAQKQVHALHTKADKAEAEAAQTAAALRDLQQRSMELAQELAATRVEAENHSGKVSALEVQLREHQLVMEKKLLAAAQEAEAAARAARLAHSQEVSALQTKLSTEQCRAGELATELAEREGQVAGLSAQLAAQVAEGAAHLERYATAQAEAASLARHAEEVRGQLAALAAQKQLAERQRDEALQAAAALEAQLEDLGEEIADQLQEAEAEQARTKRLAVATGDGNASAPAGLSGGDSGGLALSAALAAGRAPGVLGSSAAGAWAPRAGSAGTLQALGVAGAAGLGGLRQDKRPASGMVLVVEVEQGSTGDLIRSA